MKISVKKSELLQQRLNTARRSLQYRIEYAKECFSDELWQAMESRGLNQVQFAAKAGVTKQFLTRVFRSSNCTIETMAKLSEALGYHVNIHLTPCEYECDWLHYLAKEPERAAPVSAELWHARDYREVGAAESSVEA